MIRIESIADAREKSLYAARVLRELPAWFGIEDALQDYIAGVTALPFWAALKGELCVGFIAVKIHYGRIGDIYVMGILPEYQRRGIGQQLIEAAELYFRQKGCKYAIVKTLSDLASSEPYERTRRFYQKVGFEPLITLTEMWDAHNPCLIMIKEVLLTHGGSHCLASPHFGYAIISSIQRVRPEGCSAACFRKG